LGAECLGVSLGIKLVLTVTLSKFYFVKIGQNKQFKETTFSSDDNCPYQTRVFSFFSINQKTVFSFIRRQFSHLSEEFSHLSEDSFLIYQTTVFSFIRRQFSIYQTTVFNLSDDNFLFYKTMIFSFIKQHFSHFSDALFSFFRRHISILSGDNFLGIRRVHTLPLG
jgi:hypothetical protein